MTKIKNYALDLEVRGNDKWIGTDSGSLAKLTKNFTPDNLAKYYNDKEVVESVNQLRFFYDTVDPGDDRARGSFSFPTELGPEVPFSDISDLVFSRFTMGDDAVNNFMTDIVNSIIIIQKADNPDTYAFYGLNGYEVDPTDSNFYNVALSFESGNGSVVEDNDYLVSLIQFAGAAGIQTILGSEFIDSTLTGVGEVTISLSATGTPDDTTYLRGDNTWSPIVADEANLIFYSVKNSSGSQILKGKAVMAVGTDGNSGHILIDEFVADGTVEPKYFMGVLESTLDNGETGRALHFGELRQFDTRGQNGEEWNDGDILWCDPANPGDFTLVEPLGPNVKIAAAIVINSSTNGKIKVRVQGNEGIKDLYDTRITPQTDGDVLVWNDTDSVWFNDSTLNVDYTNGKVGIGTTSPIVPLHVIGDTVIEDTSAVLTLKSTQVGATSSIQFESLANAAIVGGGSADYLSFLTASNHRMRILANGNVGIGTTSPSQKLDVVGNIATDGALLADGIDGFYLNQGGGAGFSPSPGIFYSGTAGQGWYFQVPNNGIEKFSFKLGSTSANREFRVVDDSWNPLFRVQGSGALALDSYGSGTFTGTAVYTLGVDASGNVIETSGGGGGGISGSGVANQVAFWDGASSITGENNLYWDSTNDRLGVGTTSPSEKLHILGSGAGPSGRTRLQVENTNTTSAAAATFKCGTNFASFQYSGSGYAIGERFNIGTSADVPVAFATNGSTPTGGTQGILFAPGGYLASPTMGVYPSNGGRVGIGTTSPSQKLHVIGNIRVGTTSDDIFSNNFTALGNADVKLRSNIGYNLLLNAASEGYVGIGTDSPDAMLDVNGGIRMADDTATASASNEGTLRYRKDANNSYIDMCMQTGASTYAWVNIKTNAWGGFLQGLVASYNFDLDFSDYTGNHPLSAFGNTTAGVGGGVVSNCSEFDGSTGYLTVADSDDFSMTDGVNDVPFSVSCWVNFDSLDPSNGDWIINKWQNANKEWLIARNPAGDLAFIVADGVNAANLIRTDFTWAPTLSTWYHLAFTYDGSKLEEGLKIYINGSLVSSTPSSLGSYIGSVNTSSNLYVGRNIDGSVQYFDGKLDELHIWKNRELTAAEVLGIYNTENAGNSIL